MSDVASALKWAFADLETLNAEADRQTLSPEDRKRLIELLKHRPLQFCLFLNALFGEKQMEDPDGLSHSEREGGWDSIGRATLGGRFPGALRRASAKDDWKAKLDGGCPTVKSRCLSSPAAGGGPRTRAKLPSDLLCGHPCGHPEGRQQVRHSK